MYLTLSLPSIPDILSLTDKHSELSCASDAKEIWSREVENVATVCVEGQNAAILNSDLPELERAKKDNQQLLLRLIPYFDSYLLGHKSHSQIVDEENHRKLYRPQGWVSPVILVNGRAAGVWSHIRNKYDGSLEIRATLFSMKSRSLISTHIRKEASRLAQFFGCTAWKTAIG